MSRQGAPAERQRRTPDYLHRFDGAELVDGTQLTKSVFWHSRWNGVLLLDGSRQFFPAPQVKRLWWDDEETSDD